MTRATPHDDRELLNLLLQEEGIERMPTLEIRPDRASPPCLSRAQRRLWTLYQAMPDSSAYNISEAVRMTGQLDVAALEASLNEIVRRHEILRSCFPANDGRPTVVVRDELALGSPLDDLSHLPEEERQEHIQRGCSAEARRPFNLESGPLLRVRLLRLAEQDHVVTLTMHHIVSDGWSMGVFLHELNQLYRSFAAGRPSPLPELTLQYSDFARWQEEWFERKAAAEQREWWIRQLTDLTTLELPIARPRRPAPSFRGAVHVCHIPSSLVADLKALGRQEVATPYVTLLAAFAVLLHRYSGQVDIVVGSPVANRTRREIEPLIGFFVNSLVMRCDVSGQPSFRTLLRRVRDFAMEAFARQEFPFDELVKEIAPQRDAVSNPLFEVMFSFENAPIGALELPDLTLTPVGAEARAAKFDLLLNIGESPDGLVAAFQYRTDLYDADAIQRMAGHFQTLLESIVHDPDQSVETLPMLGEAERRQILVEWNQTASAFPRDTCIHELFEEQARRQPGKVAVEFSDQRLSYGELNARANQLAHYLRGLGVGPETLVALVIERSVEMVLALVGILKAGAAYVPLDPDDPEERLALLLGEIAPAVVLTQEHLANRSATTDAKVLRLDSDWSEMARERRENLQVAVPPESLAYVLFTSGSTGKPKGVSVSHRSVVRLVKETDYAHLGAEEVHLQLAPLQFDASTFEIWGSLLNGGCLVVAPPHTPSLDEIGDYIRGYRVTTLWLTAGLFHVMVDERLDGLKPLRQLLVGGDVLSVQHVARALSELQGCRLINGYGPTENTTFTCCHRIEETDLHGSSVPIGRPIANTRVYILDRHLQPTPIGIPGELCITGEGLALGYHNRPDLTNEQFIDNPIAGDPDSRMYRTGDLCRWLRGGIIEFLGRRDQQVKIRGFRVELGEIESTLVAHAAVREAVVTSRKESTGKHCLAAYVTPASATAPVPEDLRSYLESNLPAYMVPAYFVVLDKLPLNANGKVDRSRLPAPPEMSPNPDRAVEPPQNDLEQTVAGIWQSVLGGRELGVNDNYFHLGGDSITAIQLVSRLKQAGWELSVRDLFEHPTVRSLAPILRRREPRGEPSQNAVIGPVPLTPIQRWFFEEHTGELHHFNQAVLLKSAERLEEAALQQVFQRLWEHHDALRMTYASNTHGVSQSLGEAPGTPGFELVDLRHEEDEVARLQAHADQVQGSFDLRHGPLFKAILFRLKDSDRLLLVIHHLAVDGVSWRIILEDLQRGYAQSLRGEAVTFDPKTDSFQRWAQELQRCASSESVLADQTYWSNVLSRATLTFPRDMADDGPNLYGDSETVHTAFSPDETARLLTETHQAYDTEVNDLLLTALGRALKTQHGNRQVLITLEGHGREQLGMDLDLNRTIGWFTCWYPFLLPTGEGDLGDQIRAVRQALRGVPQRGLSFGLLRYLTPPHLAPGVRGVYHPQLSFNYLGQFTSGDDSALGFAPEPSGRAISPQLTRLHDLDVIGIVTDGRLSLSIMYHVRRHRRESVQQLLDAFRAQLLLVIDHCRGIRPRESVSREFTFSQLPADDVDRILRSVSDGL